jgi:hypothetical protein
LLDLRERVSLDNSGDSGMSDRAKLRELAKKYAGIANDPVQDERRKLWRAHNSLKDTRPPIYVRAFAWHEMPESKCVCEDPLLRQIEGQLRYNIFWDGFGDDSVFEPWVTVDAAYGCEGWGIGVPRNYADEPGGSFKVDYPIRALEDIEKMRMPTHVIDEAATAERFERVSEAIGDILSVNLNRGPAYIMWTGDISTELGYLRGIENFMLDMFDNPDWLKSLVKFLSDGILQVHDQAEAMGDWGLCNHQNQAMAYAEELPDPAANVRGVERKQLWGYQAAQELTMVSPEMHDEFLLKYQLPILEKFGLVAYGCCEDLTNKIEILRKIPNLRRIAVSPFADTPRCAEQIGRDYVISYRPSPADMVSYGFDEGRIRKILERDLGACRGLHVDVTLKDVETVEGDPERVKSWVELTRRVIDELGM